jgi:hypothetical protein
MALNPSIGDRIADVRFWRHTAAQGVCDGLSATGESARCIPGASVGQPTEICLVARRVWPRRSNRRQMRGNRRRRPVDLDAEIGQDHLGGIVGRQPGDVAARMAAGAAEIKTGQMGAIAAGTGKRTVVSDLAARESADQQIAFAHVRQASLDVERRAGERIDDRIGQVRRVFLPQVQHDAAKRVGIAAAEPGEGGDGLGDVGPPFERAPLAVVACSAASSSSVAAASSSSS